MENTGEVQQNAEVQSLAIVPSTAKKTAQDFASIREEFADWLARPEELRNPENQQKFGKKYGVHQATLSDWKRNGEFQARVVDLVRKYALYDFAEYMLFLKQEAKLGNVHAIELYLKVIHNYRDKIDVSARVESKREIVVRFGDEDTVPFFSQGTEAPVLAAAN